MKRVCKLALEEPFRLFFPLGLLAGLWGALMWPAYHAGLLSFYPGEAHTRMMMEGFMGAFVIGFLGTAFPRLTDNRSLQRGEFLFLLLLWGLCVASHSLGRVPAGDAAFAGMTAALFLSMGARWVLGRKDTPPPGFVLAFPGILGAAAAAWLLSKQSLPPLGTAWAKIWLFQAFLLLPLMGIAPYLLPRFFGHSSRHSFDESPTPPPGWWPRALAAASAGGLVIASLAVELHLHPTAGRTLRALVLVGWFALETPVFRRAKTPSTPANAVRWAVIGLSSGCLCAAIWPQFRIGSMHLLYASGLGLVTLAVGTRVILGHAGRHDLLKGKIVWLRWVVGLVVLAATTRMSADFLPQIRVSHLNYAAWSWALGSVVWLVAVARFLIRNDD